MWLLIFAILGALIIVLLWFIISKAVLKGKISDFKENYAQITLSMTKKQVVGIMGSNFTSSIIDGREILVLKQKTNSAVERELLTKHVSAITATVVFQNGVVVGYSID